MEIVSEQVKILIERMDMYPEEFVHPFESRHIETKWNSILLEGRFNWIEKFLIKRKYVKLKRQATREAIMATIMYETPEQKDSTSGLLARINKNLINNPDYPRTKTKKQKYDY